MGDRRLLEGGFVVLLGGHLVGCAEPAAVVNPETSEGEAVLAALEHVAALKWRDSDRSTLVEGKAAVAYGGEAPLSASTRGFLDNALEARGWRWSTEDPLLPTGNCAFPIGDCRLKDPTELHLTLSLVPPSGEACATEHSVPPPPPPEGFCWEPTAGEERHGVHVTWLSSYYSERRDRDHANLGGEFLLVTRGADGWVVERRGSWIT